MLEGHQFSKNGDRSSMERLTEPKEKDSGECSTTTQKSVEGHGPGGNTGYLPMVQASKLRVSAEEREGRTPTPGMGSLGGGVWGRKWRHLKGKAGAAPRGQPVPVTAFGASSEEPETEPHAKPGV